MRKNKLTIISLVLILLVGAGFIISKNQPIYDQSIKVEAETVIIQNSAIKQPKKKVEEIKPKINKKNAIKPEYITVFDEDPVVNNEIIEQKYEHCSQYFLFQKNKSNRNHSYSNLKTNNPDYYNKHVDYCNKINELYPEFNLEKNNIEKDNLSNSYLGQLLSDDEFAESQLQNDIGSVIKALLNADPNMMLSIYAEVAYLTFVPDLQQLLGSQQNDYIVMIGRYAQILFACRLGADCGENSAIVFYTCLSNENMCVNNIEELIKTKFSKGQQADIELAYQHLVKYFTLDE